MKAGRQQSPADRQLTRKYGRDVLFLFDGRPTGEGLIEALLARNPKVLPDEGGDDLTRLPGDVVDGLRAGTVTEHAAPRGGEIGLRVGKALVDAAADDEYVAAPLQPAHQLIAPLQIARLLLAITLQPQKGRAQVPAAHERRREDAVEVGADSEAGVLRHRLRGGGPAHRVANNARVLDIQMADQRGCRLYLR